MQLALRSRTPADTKAIGGALAALLESGDAVILTGELGAGKTTLVQGVGMALGVKEQIVSPTFTLVREYWGSLPLTHVDVYRLDRIQDFVDLGLEEMEEEGAVLFVEWGDAVEELITDRRLTLELTGPEEGTEERAILLSTSSPTWDYRWERLEQALAEWSVD